MDEESRALRAVLRIAAHQDAVVTSHDVARSAVSEVALRRMLRRDDWVPLLRGSYLVDPQRTGLALERSWARSATATVPTAVVGMATAARLHGLAGVPLPSAVQVVVAPGRERHGRERLDPHVRVLGEHEVVDLRGVRATSAVRTLADLVPRLGRLDAITVLDSALRTGAVDRDGLARAAGIARGRRGSLAVADLWGLADGRAESPLESRVRLRCVDGGVPPDDLQVVVCDGRGHFVARSDIGFRRRSRPERGLLLLEADGREVHSTPEALFRDRWRANALVALRHDLLRCVWADTLTPHRVPAMVRAAL